MATFNSKIILAKGIKLDKDYKHVLSYSESEMVDLCNTNKIAISDTFNFINATGEIKVPFTYSQCLQANYMAFQNPNYNNKWFFGFIDSIQFMSVNTTKINYTIDVWSTWWEKWSVKPCFTVREHVSNDSIGMHTIDEGLDVGEVESIYNTKVFDSENNFYIAIASTHNPVNNTDFQGVSMYNKNFYGFQLFLFKIDLSTTATIQSSVEPIIKFLNDIQTQVQNVNCISDMFIIPKELINKNDLNLLQYDIYLIYTLKYTTEPNFKNAFIPFADTTPAGKYHPKNSKCYCYPYNYLFVSNNNGNSNIYKYENFDGVESQGINQILFKIVGAISVGYSCNLIPCNYKGIEENIDEALPLAKFPVCGWASDSYINWLTQNAVNIPNKLIGVGESAVNYDTKMQAGEFLAKEPATQMASISSGFSIANNILSVIGSFKMAKMLPNITQGGNNGDVNFSDNKINFSFYQMRCKDEYMKVVDDYFNMFGYKVNNVKIPNLTGRKNWNYIEIGATENIGYGTAPAIAMDIINKACRRGITIWHSHNNLGNYTLDNSIL